MTIVVTVLPDGARFPVRDGETVLAAARRYGYRLPAGCREGGCGGCALELVGGDVVYGRTVAQSVLSDRDRACGVCLPCRAEPVTDAVIRLNRTDRLGRGPFSDRLASRDLERAGRVHAPDHGVEQRMSVDELAPPLAGATSVHEREADLRIERRVDAATGVVTLTLTDPAGADLPEWSPGAHIDLVLSPELTRQYSLCGSPRDRRSYRIGVLRDPNSRGGSEHVHEQLPEGGTVRVRGPRNHFSFIDSPEYLFIAGGIGITPLLPMIASAEAVGADWRLVYGGRSRDSMAFLDELAGYGDRVAVHPQDEAGHLPLRELLAEARDGVQIYGCGPGPLLDALESASAHWQAGSLHIERFAARDVSASAGALDSFEVVCQRSGTTLQIGPDRSILEAAEEAGIKVLASCRAGVCGTCDVDVLDGRPEHRDSVLSAAERAADEFMLVCISRSLSPRLVLDM